jgi:hypothetical protein
LLGGGGGHTMGRKEKYDGGKKMKMLLRRNISLSWRFLKYCTAAMYSTVQKCHFLDQILSSISASEFY